MDEQVYPLWTGRAWPSPSRHSDRTRTAHTLTVGHFRRPWDYRPGSGLRIGRCTTTFLPKLGKGGEVRRSYITGCETKFQASKPLISLPQQYRYGACQKHSPYKPNTASFFFGTQRQKKQRVMILTAKTNGTSKRQDLPSGRARCPAVAERFVPLFLPYLFMNKSALGDYQVPDTVPGPGDAAATRWTKLPV